MEGGLLKMRMKKWMEGGLLKNGRMEKWFAFSLNLVRGSGTLPSMVIRVWKFGNFLKEIDIIV